MAATSIMQQIRLTSLQYRYVTRCLIALHISKPTKSLVTALAKKCAAHVQEVFQRHISCNPEQYSKLSFKGMSYPDIEARYLKECPKPYAILNNITPL